MEVECVVRYMSKDGTLHDTEEKAIWNTAVQEIYEILFNSGYNALSPELQRAVRFVLKSMVVNGARFENVIRIVNKTREYVVAKSKRGQ